VLCLKRCNDMAALSLRACTGLQVLHAGDCSQLTNEGLANLRTLKSLHKLQMESASQVRAALCLLVTKVHRSCLVAAVLTP